MASPLSNGNSSSPNYGHLLTCLWSLSQTSCDCDLSPHASLPNDFVRRWLSRLQMMIMWMWESKWVNVAKLWSCEYGDAARVRTSRKSLILSIFITSNIGKQKSLSEKYIACILWCIVPIKVNGVTYSEMPYLQRSVCINNTQFENISTVY